MQNKIVISPSNKKALAILRDLQKKKAKLQQHFAKKGKIGSLNLKKSWELCFYSYYAERDVDGSVAYTFKKKQSI